MVNIIDIQYLLFYNLKLIEMVVSNELFNQKLIIHLK